MIGLLLVLGSIGALAGGGVWLWQWIDRALFGQWTESYEVITKSRKEQRMDWRNWLLGTGEPDEGTTRELPEPQTCADTWPATATHEVWQGGRWLPAAGEAYADGRTDVIPVIQWADEAAD